MVSANKILTVSYGTFSCTLEGFEDPFSTMRAIAEYFRDLAADDRYFGAEPPTPDAEMLHRIAEREIQRRVEAKVQANGVVLRASEQPAADSPAASPAPETGPHRLTGAPAAPRAASAPADAPAAPAAAAAAIPAAEDVIDDFAQDRVAAKLLRIRAAVSQPPAPAEAEAEERARAEAEAEEQRQAEERARAEAEDDEEDEDEAALLMQSRVLQVSRIQPLEAEDDEEDADVVPQSEDEDEDDSAEDAHAVGDDAGKTEAPEAVVHEVEEADAPEQAETDDDAWRAADDGAAARADEGADADDDSDLVARVARSVGQTGLSPEDETELFEELAEVQSDQTGTAESGSTLLRQVAGSEEAAMSRLMKQAENELAGPENRRRLSAIEHLRAAVAATRAERQDPGAKAPGDQDETAIDQYRDDLAEAVRPRRPVPANSRGASRRPAPPMERIAPLVLVSEQRIDKSDAPPRTIRPIRPRRLSAGNLALEDDDDDFGNDDAQDENILTSDVTFAEFVKRIGATELTDLMEAAAVYCAQVEGRQNFSRPQLLRKLSDLPNGEEISREEGLRGFGRLLREGRFVKIRRGQFAVKDDSRYLPEARRLAQG